MDKKHERFTQVSSLRLENGTRFYARVIGLPYFVVALEETTVEGPLPELSGKE